MPQQAVSGAYRILAIFAWVMVVAAVTGIGLEKLAAAGYVGLTGAGFMLFVLGVIMLPAALDRWLP